MGEGEGIFNSRKQYTKTDHNLYSFDKTLDFWYLHQVKVCMVYVLGNKQINILFALGAIRIFKNLIYHCICTYNVVKVYMVRLSDTILGLLLPFKKRTLSFFRIISKFHSNLTKNILCYIHIHILIWKMFHEFIPLYVALCFNILIELIYIIK